MRSYSESHLNVYVRPPHTSSWVLFSCLDLKPFLSRGNWARALGHQWVKTPHKQVSAPVVLLVWSWGCSPRAAVSASPGSLWEKQILGLHHRLVEFSSGDGTRQCVLKCVTWCTLQCENHCTRTHQGGWRVGEVIFHHKSDVYSWVTSLWWYKYCNWHFLIFSGPWEKFKVLINWYKLIKIEQWGINTLPVKQCSEITCRTCFP